MSASVISWVAQNVIDAAKRKAQELGLQLSDGAKDAIEERVSPAVENLSGISGLAGSAEDIRQNNYNFIEYVYQTQLGGKRGIVAIHHISNSLKSYYQSIRINRHCVAEMK